MEASSDGIVGIKSCKGGSCLDELQRQLVSDCALCLGKRQKKAMPNMPEPNYIQDQEKPKGSKQDCSTLDLEMFCLGRTFPAQFFRHAEGYAHAAQKCFFHMQNAGHCRVDPHDLDRAYAESIEFADSRQSESYSWTEDYPKFSGYIQAYKKKRAHLVSDCLKCVSKNTV